MAYYNYLNQVHPSQRGLWPIDVYASGGMNGFLWLSERNGFRMVIPSPIKGLGDIMNNHVINATYINPVPHKHIPEPPRGVAMPKKILKSIDIKPLPILWHEDNGGRRGQGSYNRPQVPGAIHGNMLGEAAHRLLKNSLNIRSNGPSPGYYNQPNYQNTPGQHRPRPAGPSSGHGRNPNEDQFSYQNTPNNPRASMPRPRFGYSPSNNNNNNNNQYNRQNIKPQETAAYTYQQQYQDLSNGMSALTMDNGSRSNRQYPVRGAAPPQTAGILPSPPPTWISRPATEGNAAAAAGDKDVKKVYQIKTRVSQDSGNGI